MSNVCLKSLNIPIDWWSFLDVIAARSSMATAEDVATFTGGYAHPNPPTYSHSSRVWRYFGPFSEDARIRVRMHYNLPFYFNGRPYPGNWDHVIALAYGWIVVPNPNPLLDVPAKTRTGRCRYDFAGWPFTLGMDWTLTEDLEIPQGDRSRYLVTLASTPYGLFVPNNQVPTLEMFAEIVLRDPLTGLFPAFTTPASSEPVDSTWPPGFTDEDGVIGDNLDGVFSFSGSRTIPNPVVPGNGNSSKYTIYESSSASAIPASELHLVGIPPYKPPGVWHSCIDMCTQGPVYSSPPAPDYGPTTAPADTVNTSCGITSASATGTGLVKETTARSDHPWWPHAVGDCWHYCIFSSFWDTGNGVAGFQVNIEYVIGNPPGPTINFATSNTRGVIMSDRGGYSLGYAVVHTIPWKADSQYP